jgi:hypothetical protein
MLSESNVLQKLVETAEDSGERVGIQPRSVQVKTLEYPALDAAFAARELREKFAFPAIEPVFEIVRIEDPEPESA